MLGKMYVVVIIVPGQIYQRIEIIAPHNTMPKAHFFCRGTDLDGAVLVY